MVVLSLTARTEMLAAPGGGRIRLAKGHDTLDDILHVAAFYDSGWVADGIQAVFECEEHCSHERSCCIIPCHVQVVDMNIEVREEVTETNIRALGTCNASLSRHGLRIDDLDDCTVTTQVHSESALDVFELILDRVADQYDGLKSPYLVTAQTRTHEGIDDDLFRFLRRDELGCAEVEDLRIATALEVVLKMSVWHDPGMRHLYACQNVLGVRGR